MSKKKKAFAIRTDLALEACEMLKANEDTEIDGIVSSVKENKDTSITCVDIINEQGSKAVGKPIGKYITIEDQGLRTNNIETKERIIEETTKALKLLLKNFTAENVLIAGLGNRFITPDALGPKVVSGILVTRHIKDTLPEEMKNKVNSVSAIAPGVMGITGIETAEVLAGIAKKAKPDLIIAVDALAARKFSRVNAVIQMTDSGISPGAGVGNKRAKINKKSMGVPVIAIGVPTVVDAATLVNDTMDRILDEMKAASENKAFYEMLDNIQTDDRYTLINDLLTPYAENMFVTPKEVDSVIDRLADIISSAINAALQPGLKKEDINMYI